MVHLISMRHFLCIISLLFFSVNAFSQPENNDKFHGTWEWGTPGISGSVYAKLEVSYAHDYIIYPARLTLRLNDFEGVYQMLLAKKNTRQLAIGNPKKIISETPFSTENYLLQFNGVLDISSDRNNNSFLTLERIRFNKVKLKNKDEEYSASTIADFLTNTAVKFKKVNDTGWYEPAIVEEMMNSPYSGFYYGKRDTLIVKSERGIGKFTGRNSGIATASINGRNIFEMSYANDKSQIYEIKLDHGVNTLALFIDEYGKKPQQSANFELDFYSVQTQLNFSAKDDYTSTVILLPIVRAYNEDNASNLRNNLKQMKEQMKARNETMYFYPDEEGNLLTVSNEVEKTLLRESTVVGNLKAASREVILGIWDDAVEDGDSISLNINGTWVVQGMPVLKKPQFIVVKLNAGVNKIIFIADNQGSIIPNTSMLEIIDEGQRKSYKINTDFNQNNLINILYELPPEKAP